MGVRREEFEQPSFEILNDLEHPELHTGSIPEMSFFVMA